jgi:hypothetical protein
MNVWTTSFLDNPFIYFYVFLRRFFSIPLSYFFAILLMFLKYNLSPYNIRFFFLWTDKKLRKCTIVRIIRKRTQGCGKCIFFHKEIFWHVWGKLIAFPTFCLFVVNEKSLTADTFDSLMDIRDHKNNALNKIEWNLTDIIKNPHR